MTNPAVVKSSLHLLIPPKLWELIFLRLTPLQLLRVRAVCCQWRDLVTASRLLMDRFGAVLAGEQMNRRYRPPLALPVGRLQLAEFRINGTGPWWAGYGPWLTELRLNGCTMTVRILYELLKKTPNLKRLEIIDSEFSGSGTPNFVLEKLECFTVDNPEFLQLPQELIDYVEQAFPRLKELRLLNGATKARLDKSIRILKSTLKRLELFEGQSVELLCKIDGLQLKEFTGNIDYSSYAWLLFCRMQPRIEKMQVTAKHCHVLRHIGRALPNLKCLPLQITTSFKADFLNGMPNLENLDIEGHLNDLDFLSAANPKLNHFEMANTQATRLILYLQKSPDLEFIHLDNCTLIGDSGNPGNIPKLRYLALSKCNLPSTLTLALCLQNPQLQYLHLRCLPHLTDDQFALICETVGPNLRELAVIQCDQLTDAAGEFLARNFGALEMLFFGGFQLSGEIIGLLKKRHVRVIHWCCRFQSSEQQEEPAGWQCSVC